MVPMNDKKPKKRGRGRPRDPEAVGGRRPKYLLYVRIDPKIGKRIERFVEKQRLKPSLTSFVERAVMDFLDREDAQQARSNA